MAGKYNYEYVKEFISTKSGGKCKLISTEYKTCSTPLKLQCSCGNIFCSNFYKIKKTEMQCKDCRNKKASEKYRLDIAFVKKYIKDNGCEYVSGDYINTSSKLTIKCGCGNVFIKDFSHFQRGQNRCPECGKKSSRQSRFKYDLESSREIFATRGFELLDDKYIDCETPMKCKCSKGHLVELILSRFLVGKSGCKTCANLNLCGEANHNYKGGESEVIDHFRKLIKQWKQDVMKNYGYKCYLTNSSKDMVIHHLKGFMTIIRECCEELNIPLHRKLNEYSQDELMSFNNLFLAKHTPNIGIVLQRKVHKKFHSIYGMLNNTLEQFNEFIKKYYPHCKEL